MISGPVGRESGICSTFYEARLSAWEQRIQLLSGALRLFWQGKRASDTEFLRQSVLPLAAAAVA